MPRSTDSHTREKIIQATYDLLENYGYHATGLKEIVSKSGAPKGSIYYYFPDGKEGIAAETIAFAGEQIAERIRANLMESADPAQAVRAFLETIAHFVEVSGFEAGGPLTIVASETATTSEKLNAACRDAYNRMRTAFAEKFRAGGFSTDQAQSLAWTVTSAVEGGIILCRTYHTGDPLREVARQMALLISVVSANEQIT
ncbi:MAG TPA: TetR/AcrR family transcriptional regulator [Anaerolineaceae bacterium]